MKKSTTFLAVLILGSFFIAQTAFATSMFWNTTDLGAGGYSSVYNAEIIDGMAGSVTDVSFGMAYDFNQDGDLDDPNEKYEIFQTDFATTTETARVYFQDFGGVQYISDGISTNPGVDTTPTNWVQFDTSMWMYYYEDHNVFDALWATNPAYTYDWVDPNVTGSYGRAISAAPTAYPDEWLFLLETGSTLNMKVEVRDIAPVPEPATMVLFGAGLLGLAAIGRKKFIG